MLLHGGVPRICVLFSAQPCDEAAHRGADWTPPPSLARPVPILDGLLKAEACFCNRATQLLDSMYGSTLVCLRQFFGDLCVKTRYRKAPRLVEYVPDCQSAGERRIRPSATWV